MKILLNDYLRLAAKFRFGLIYAVVAFAIWGAIEAKGLPGFLSSALAKTILILLVIVPVFVLLGVIVMAVLFVCQCAAMLITGKQQRLLF